MSADVLLDEEYRPIVLRGVCLPYGKWITTPEGQRERFRYGAFAEQGETAFMGTTLQWEHQPGSPVVASTIKHSLSVYDDVQGLMFETYLEAVPASCGILSVLRSAGLSCSIMFAPGHTTAPDGTITKARLMHIGLIQAGGSCYPTTAWREPDHHYIRASLTEEQLHWRRHLESHIRRLERDEINARQARERKPKRSHARMRVTAR